MPANFFSPPERSDFSDNYYSSIGRLLSLAQVFEGKAKALALFMNVKSDPAMLFERGKDYNRLIHKLYEKPNLSRNLDFITSALGITDDGKEVLKQARDQRNYVAHELAVFVAENEEQQLDFLVEKTREIATDLADGEMLLSAILTMLEKSELPRADAVDGIKERIVEWVCDLE